MFYVVSTGTLPGLALTPAPNPGDFSPAKSRGLESQKSAGGAGAGPGAVDAGFLPGVSTWDSAGDAGAGVLPEVPNLKRISPAKR